LFISTRPSVPPSGSDKRLEIRPLGDTVHYKSFYFLTYLLTNVGLAVEWLLVLCVWLQL